MSAQAYAQVAPPPSTAPASVEQGISLAAKRRCDEALPLLSESIPNVSDRQLKYRSLLATARCGIHKKDGKVTVNALMALRHDYPNDPEVLYLTAQVFLKIAVHASQALEASAPNSYQLFELKAESLESQGKWDEAAAVYRRILEQNPKLPEIHLRLGRALLSQSRSLEENEEATKEFAQELAIDPTNAAAEFWIGEVARLNGRSEDAIAHFTSAIKLDSTFAPSFLMLGMSYNASGKFAEAIDPLEKYTAMVQDDPAGHLHLGRAYLRANRKEDSDREFAVHRKLLEKIQPLSRAPETASPQ